jgi:3-isopropylmalate dehydrogenase
VPAGVPHAGQRVVLGADRDVQRAGADRRDECGVHAGDPVVDAEAAVSEGLRDAGGGAVLLEGELCIAVHLVGEPDERLGTLRDDAIDDPSRLRSPDTDHGLHSIRPCGALARLAANVLRKVDEPWRCSVADYRIAVLGGDGIGPEVIAEGLKVLDAVELLEGFSTERVQFDLGGRRYLRTGEVLGEETLEELRGFDAIYLGAVGTPDVPPGILERGLLLKLRFAFDQFVNLRPVRLYDGVSSPIAGLTRERCDFVVVRENTESVYAGAGGTIYVGTPHEVATQESINTRHGVERIVRYAFELARRRRGHLTLVHKTNVLVHAGALWQRTVDEVGDADYPDVARSYVHVDAACLYLVTQPERFDVIVTENLFGDIITDLAAAIQGGLGLAASGNLNPTGAAPSMFEPVHGSAPDIVGTGKADPVAAVLSLGQMLDAFGRSSAAARVDRAVAALLSERQGRVPDGLTVSTADVGDRLVALLDS